MDFVPYPDIHKDPEAYDKLFRKREFIKTRYGPDFKYSSTEDLCRRGEFRMQPHQEFVRNFLSPETPYNGILLFHGTGVGKTCAAIGITEGLRDYVHKNGKKIYILSSENIRPNFYKELYDPGRAAVENDMHSIPGSFQCAGDRYYVDGPMRPDVRLKAVRNLIKEYYEFYGFSQFANFVDIGLGADIPVDPATGRPKRRPKIPDVDIGEYFSNSVIVIDEAHGVAGEDKRGNRKLAVQEGDYNGPEGIEAAQDPEIDDAESLADDDDADMSMIERAGAERILSKRSLLRVLLDTIIPSVRSRGGTLKIILLTATPMKDNQTELADLLELLNTNDGVKLSSGWRKQLYPDESSYNPEILRQLARGYVSYVKSNNPISFPQMLLPPPADIYEPRPIFDYLDGMTDVREEFEVYLDTERQKPFMFNLVNCRMSEYQLDSYLSLRKRVINGEQSDPSDTYSRMISNIAYPGAKTYGNEGFTACFGRPRALEEPKDAAEKQQRWKVYGYTEKIWKESGPFLMCDNPINPESSLHRFSKKFDMFINYVNRSPGIVYAYSEFVQSGALLAALVLEANGYVHYSPALEQGINKATGLPRKEVPRTRLFMLNASQRESMVRAGVNVDTRYRCARCGDWYDEHRLPSHPCSGFVLATYILVTGDHGGIKDIEYVNSRENIRGEKIKVVLGTKVTGQGVDFHWIRQVHILDPWHNNTRIYQAIGRGIRHCSHAELRPDERNVVVYKYASSTGYIEDQENPNDPDSIEDGSEHTYRELSTETVDERMYRRIIGKDILVKSIERILKETAVDCELNKHRNMFATDVDYSRECDYTSCNYRCDGFANPVEELRVVIKKTTDNRWRVSDGAGNMEAITRLLDSPIVQEGLRLLKAPERSLKAMRVRDTEVSNLAVWRFFRRYVFKILKNEGFASVIFSNRVELRQNSNRTFSLRMPDEASGTPIADDTEFARVIIDGVSSLVDIPMQTSVAALWQWLISNPNPQNYDSVIVPGDELLELSIPNTSIDNSTYDIYFTAPHVSAAEKIISRIFQSSVAMRLERIVYLVHLANPTIDDEFIYMALDKIVGNPPFIKPRILTDRFDRKGYIIYRAGFYLFQPVELSDINIPMEYRRQPLRVKPAFYSMNRLEHGDVAPKRGQPQESTVDDKSMTDVLVAMQKALAGDLNKAGMGRGDIFNIIMVQQILDGLLLTELAYLTERLLPEYRGAAGAPDISLATVLVEYLVSKGLAYFVGNDGKKSGPIQPLPVLLKSPNHIFFHILRKSVIRTMDEDGSWKEIAQSQLPTIPEWNERIDKLFSAPIKYLPLIGLEDKPAAISIHNLLNNDYRNPAAVFGFLARAQTVRNPVMPERNEEAMKTRVDNFYREYPNKETLKEVKFKVVSQSSLEGKAKTKSGAVSSRTVLRGIVCMTMNPVKRDSAIENAEAALTAALERVPAGNPVVKSIAKYLDIVPNDQGASKCRRLETVLRLLDYYNVNSLRWFLSPFDTEYYMPAIVKTR